MEKPTKPEIRLRPSSASRWLNCPGSAVLDAVPREVPDETGNEYTREGKRAHYLAELSLAEWKKNPDSGRYESAGGRPESLAGVTIYAKNDDGTPDGFLVTREMVDHVRTYLDEVKRREEMVRELDGPFYSIIVEKYLSRVYRGHVIGGTADVVIASPRSITVLDFKYGAGVEVSAVQNDQLRIYLRNALATFESAPAAVKRLSAVVVQPRIHYGRGAITEWNIEGENVRQFASVTDKLLETAVSETVVRAGAGLPVCFNPSPSSCHWCNSAAYCPALKEVFNMLAKIDFSSAVKCSDEEIREILALGPCIEKYIKDVSKVGLRRVMNGTPLPGFKLVEGGRPSNRTWKDETTVATVLSGLVHSGLFAESEVFDPRTPVSPTKIEKIKRETFVGKEFVEKNATRESKDRPTILVPESDERPEIATASSEFGEFLRKEVEEKPAAKTEKKLSPAKPKKSLADFDL